LALPSSQVSPATTIPSPQLGEQVPVPLPLKPGAHVPHTELLAVVHVSPLAQFGMAVQAVHVAVPLPKNPLEHVGHANPLPFVALQVSGTEQFAIVPQSVQTFALSNVPVPHAVHVPVPSPTVPAAHVAHTELLAVVHVSPLAQLGMAVQAAHVAVPLPKNPLEHVGHANPLPFVALHVSGSAQFGIVPQSVQTPELSKVPVVQAVQVPVPSPPNPGEQVGQTRLLPSVTLQVSGTAQPLMSPQGTHASSRSNVPVPQAMQVDPPSPTVPGAQVPHRASLALVQVSPAAQLVMGLQAVQLRVSSPKKPTAQSGQLRALPSTRLHVSATSQPVMSPQATHASSRSNVPVPQAVQVRERSPTKPGAQTAQLESLGPVQERPLAQSGIGVHTAQPSPSWKLPAGQVEHIAVPSPLKPGSQVPQIESVASEQSSPLAQFGIGVQAAQVSPSSKVPGSHAVQASVPSPMKPSAHVAHVESVASVQVSPLAQSGIAVHAVQSPVPSPKKPASQVQAVSPIEGSSPAAFVALAPQRTQAPPSTRSSAAQGAAASGPASMLASMPASAPPPPPSIRERSNPTKSWQPVLSPSNATSAHGAIAAGMEAWTRARCAETRGGCEHAAALGDAAEVEGRVGRCATA
jgi:hypothetical protein